VSVRVLHETPHVKQILSTIILNMGSENDNLPPRQYCTFAVTGEHKANQAIFVCRTCSTSNSTRRKAVLEAEGGERTVAGEDDSPDVKANDDSQGEQLLCVCQGCAEACHADHDGLEYIGFGPAYCDCRVHGSTDECGRLATCCQLVQSSSEAAIRMKLTRQPSEVKDNGPAATNFSEGYRMEAFVIQELVDEVACRRIYQSACELVKLTKETFWIDPATVDVTSLCDLEKLALSMYQHHASSTDQHLCGAEWWVQVKPAQDPESGAVDLHFDKDEALAECFGLGYFPHLSTVTYLSGASIESDLPGPGNRAQPQSPTIVLSRVYAENHNDGKAVEVLISHPRRGKHLVFDGRLLHGAPATLELREAPVDGQLENATAPDVVSQFRVTFLVNLWSQHKPASVEALPEDIRRVLKDSQVECLESPAESRSLDGLSFRRLTVPERVVSSAPDLCSEDPLYLPFVSRNATWAVCEDEEEDEVVLSMLLPREVRQSNFHTVLFRFDADLSPFLTSAADGDSDN
jgi:hypothetical protein